MLISIEFKTESLTMKTLKYNGVFWAVCMGVGLSGCVVAPPMQRGVVVQQPPPVYVQPGYPQPMYPQALYPPPVYVAPLYASPGVGWVWSAHPRQGWGWRHPHQGWHRGWR